MGSAPSLRSMPSGGDRRSIGRSDEAVKLVGAEPKRVAELAELLWDSDEVVRMRAADALEKLSRDHLERLEPLKPNLLGLMAETRQKELRWHLAAIVPRLKLTQAERRRVTGIFEGYLEDRSSIVKTFAMQGLWDLSLLDAGLRGRVVELVRELTRTGTAAMRARGRNLLKNLGSEDG
jgi:hypothetical protein